MATRTALRTRLGYRVQRGTPSTALQNVLNEAMDAAIIRYVTEGQYGINKRVLVGGTWGNLSLSSVVTSAGSATVTCSGQTFTTANVYAGDIIEFNSQRWLVHEVLTNTTLSLGTPQQLAFSGTGTLYRRTIELPDPGYIVGAARIGTDDGVTGMLESNPLGWLLAPLAVGLPRGFDVAYDQAHDKAFLSLFPGPDTNERIAVSLTDLPTELTSDSVDLDWSRPALDSLLESARVIALTWLQAGRDPYIMAAARKLNADAADGIVTAASSPGHFSR